MKKILTFAMLWFVAVQYAQTTADEVITKYIENTGGKAKWEALQGTKTTGTANFGMEFPFENVLLKDGKQYTKINFQGKELMQQVFDGQKFWGVNFMTQQPEEAPAEDTQNFMKNGINDFPSPFLNYKDKGYQIELVGEDTKEGTVCYKIKLTQNPEMVEGVETPKISFYYFDKDNFVPIVSEFEIPSGPNKGQLVSSVFSDYQEVEGLYFPFSVNAGGALLKFTKIELNPTVDPEVFNMPE